MPIAKHGGNGIRFIAEGEVGAAAILFRIEIPSLEQKPLAVAPHQNNLGSTVITKINRYNSAPFREESNHSSSLKKIIFGFHLNNARFFQRKVHDKKIFRKNCDLGRCSLCIEGAVIPNCNYAAAYAEELIIAFK